MRQLVFTLLMALLAHSSSWSQVTATLYYNDKWELTTQEKSTAKREATLDLEEMVFDKVIKDYDQAGNLLAEGTYTKGQKTGTFKTYENGVLRSVIEYPNNSFVILELIGPEGEQLIKNGTGRFTHPVTYMEGMFEKRHWKDAELSGEFKNGKRVGTWVYESADKKFRYEEIYQDGTFLKGKAYGKEKAYDYHKLETILTLGYNTAEKFNFDISTLNNLQHFFELYPLQGTETIERAVTYPGGMNALLSQIGTNIYYPAEDARVRRQGMVIISLTVDEHGNIIEQQVVKSLSPTLDAEALRVIQLHKDKICPAMLNGKTYQSVLSIPISFKLG